MNREQIKRGEISKEGDGKRNIEKLFTKMAYLCSRREYCSCDIREKLLRKNVVEEDIIAILNRLQEEKFIDDRRYVAAYYREKVLISGWGEKKIEFYLKRKGIESDIIKDVFLHSEIDSEVRVKRVNEVLLRKWNSLMRGKDEEQKKAEKLYRFGLGRGFGYDEIKSFLTNNK